MHRYTTMYWHSEDYMFTEKESLISLVEPEIGYKFIA